MEERKIKNTINVIVFSILRKKAYNEDEHDESCSLQRDLTSIGRNGRQMTLAFSDFDRKTRLHIPEPSTSANFNYKYRSEFHRYDENTSVQNDSTRNFS